MTDPGAGEGVGSIIASGVRYRRLEVPGLADLEGRGVYYAASELEAKAVAGRDGEAATADGGRRLELSSFTRLSAASQIGAEHDGLEPGQRSGIGLSRRCLRRCVRACPR
jgi:hypothetical protein